MKKTIIFVTLFTIMILSVNATTYGNELLHVNNFEGLDFNSAWDSCDYTKDCNNLPNQYWSRTDSDTTVVYDQYKTSNFDYLNYKTSTIEDLKQNTIYRARVGVDSALGLNVTMYHALTSTFSYNDSLWNTDLTNGYYDLYINYTGLNDARIQISCLRAATPNNLPCGGFLQPACTYSPCKLNNISLKEVISPAEPIIKNNIKCVAYIDGERFKFRARGKNAIMKMIKKLRTII